MRRARYVSLLVVTQVVRVADYALAISAFSAAETATAAAPMVAAAIFIAAHAIGLFGATPAHADPPVLPGVPVTQYSN
jgi:hypothetical protein